MQLKLLPWVASRPFILLTSFFGSLLGSVDEFYHFGLWWVGGWVGGGWSYIFCLLLFHIIFQPVVGPVGGGRVMLLCSFFFAGFCGWMVVEPSSFSYHFALSCWMWVGGWVGGRL